MVSGQWSTDDGHPQLEQIGSRGDCGSKVVDAGWHRGSWKERAIASETVKRETGNRP
ncbi:MAG: hypothetical protein LDL41_07510 [Coleofasciculus sp. S288]|nr:hypothetical protein [Coleofasciculus sp. S288]